MNIKKLLILASLLLGQIILAEKPQLDDFAERFDQVFYPSTKDHYQVLHKQELQNKKSSNLGGYLATAAISAVLGAGLTFLALKNKHKNKEAFSPRSKFKHQPSRQTECAEFIQQCKDEFLKIFPSNQISKIKAEREVNSVSVDVWVQKPFNLEIQRSTLFGEINPQFMGGDYSFSIDCTDKENAIEPLINFFQGLNNQNLPKR